MVTNAGVSDDVAQLQAAAASSVRGVAAKMTGMSTKLEKSLEVRFVFGCCGLH